MPSRRRLLWTVVAAAAPWTWFAVRDLAAVFEVAAILLPVIGGMAGAGALVTVWRAPAAQSPPAPPAGWRSTATAFLVSVATVAVTATVLPRVPTNADTPVGDTFYLVSANLATDNPDAERVIRGLAAGFPDVIVTVETSERAMVALTDLADEYPHIVQGEEGLHSRVVVYSRFPLSPLPSPEGLDFARVLPVVVEAAAGDVTLFAAHLPRPWITGAGETSYQATLGDQQDIVAALAEAVAATPGPVVVAGDLNLTDRGRGYRTLLAEGGLTDMMSARWAGSTSLRWWPLALRIDHVLARGGICGASPARLTLPGSDHRGLWVELGRCG